MEDTPGKGTTGGIFGPRKVKLPTAYWEASKTAEDKTPHYSHGHLPLSPIWLPLIVTQWPQNSYKPDHSTPGF